jgi:ParB/RepB/Spo0J family partition protein
MSEPTVAVLSVDAITVTEGFNPRTNFDEGELASLASSLRSTEGVVQPLAVQPGEGGGYVLVAGERRLRAARQAGIEKVPVVVLDGDKAMLAALAENLIRVDLDPIEVAQGLQALADLEGLNTHKKIAEKVGKSAAFVSDHLRLLKLPEGVQHYIAAGKVPVAAERVLRKVAKASPSVAEALCTLVACGEAEARDLVERPCEVLQRLAESESKATPTMIDAEHGESLSRIVTDAERHAALVERYRAVVGHERSADPFIRFSEAEVDAACAAGCLVEVVEKEDRWTYTSAYITDATFAADLAERVVDRIESEAVERAKAQAENAGAEVPGDEKASPAEKVKEARRAERAKLRKAAEDAHQDNIKLGRKLIARRGGKSRQQHSLARAKAVAAVILADNPTLAAQGMGLAFEQLQEIEEKTLKSTGEQRTKVTYTASPDCQEYLASRIEEARSANEVLELLGDALIAALLTDEGALPRSKQFTEWLRTGSQLRVLLADDIKSVAPRRRANN